jgi:hypothetical protein
MNVASLVSFLAMVFPLSASLAEEQTDYLIKKHRSRHQDFEWRFHVSRLLSTPEWDIDTAQPPLGPEKAWKIARQWLEKHGCERPTLVSIEIAPFVREGETWDIDARLSKRFYYTVRCIPAYLDIMIVYLLMDGSVVEPLQEPHDEMW